MVVGISKDIWQYPHSRVRLSLPNPQPGANIYTPGQSCLFQILNLGPISTLKGKAVTSKSLTWGQYPHPRAKMSLPNPKPETSILWSKSTCTLIPHKKHILVIFCDQSAHLWGRNLRSHPHPSGNIMICASMLRHETPGTIQPQHQRITNH